MFFRRNNHADMYSRLSLIGYTNDQVIANVSTRSMNMLKTSKDDVILEFSIVVCHQLFEYFEVDSRLVDDY